MMRVFGWFVILAWAIAAPMQLHSQERAAQEAAAPVNRIALLIGNTKYDQTPLGPDEERLPKLSNPCNDVEKVEASLERSGWKPAEIIKICDATRSKLRDGVDLFKDVYIKKMNSFGFIYYAGHGVQVGSETYLFGVDAYMNLANSADMLKYHRAGNIFSGSVRLYGDVISQVGDAGSGSIFIVVDACRDTPVDQYIRQNMAKDPASAQVFMANRPPAPLQGIKLLFSTAYGQKASDGMGLNSPFALAFTSAMLAEGKINDLVDIVVNQVMDDTKNSGLPQTPDTSGAIHRPPPVVCLTKCGS